MHKNNNINNNNNHNNASASTSDQFSKNTHKNRNLISSCDNKPDKGHCNSNRFGFTKISANVRKNFNKLMHKQHSPNAESFDSAITNSYGHSISLTHDQANAPNANNSLATRCRNLSLQDTDIDTNDYIKLQTQLIDNLRNLTESEKSEIVVLNNEIEDLRKQIEMRNQPIIAQIDIDKLKEDIRVLTYQKAELELAIRKKSLWTCKRCQIPNQEVELKCLACYSDRDDGVWTCSYCHVKNLITSQKCRTCNHQCDGNINIGNFPHVA